VLSNRPPLTDAPVPEVALRAPVGPMHPSPEGERLPVRSQRGAMADLGGLVDLSQRCSPPVLSGNFVPLGQHFGDSLREVIDPVTPTTFVRAGGYNPDAHGRPCSGNRKFVSLTNSEFEKGNLNVSTPQGLPMGARDPTATQVSHSGNDSICYTPVSSGPLATYETPCSAEWRDVRYSEHRMRFEHAPHL
jgi:hypothetical protein